MKTRTAEVVEPNRHMAWLWDFSTNVGMAFVLGFCAWKAYGVVRPLIWDDSVPLPLVFDETPTDADRLPENFRSPENMTLSQSRFVGETSAGFQYWLFTSEREVDGIPGVQKSDQVAEICLYVRLRDGSGALDCNTMDEFAFEGLLVGFEESADSNDGELLTGAGRYLAEGMGIENLPAQAFERDRFTFVEGDLGQSASIVASFANAAVTGGTDLPDVDEEVDEEVVDEVVDETKEDAES